jgi:cytochrome c-type biogenesis protein CcmE
MPAFINMSRGVKLLIAAVLVGSAISYLAFLGGAKSWQYYLTVDEAVADAPRLTGRRIRVSGHVEAGSLTMAADRRQANFILVGESHKVHAVCRCGLPDNLAENIDVVVEGTLQNGTVSGQKVITRCASKYKQKELSTGPRVSLN